MFASDCQTALGDDTLGLWSVFQLLVKLHLDDVLLHKRVQLPGDDRFGARDELGPEPLHEQHADVKANAREQNIAARDLEYAL